MGANGLDVIDFEPSARAALHTTETVTAQGLNPQCGPPFGSSYFF